MRKIQKIKLEAIDTVSDVEGDTFKDWANGEV